MRHLRSAQALCLKIHSTAGHIALSKDIEAPCTCTARQQMHFTQPCCQMQHNHSSRSGAAVSLQSQPVGHRPARDNCIQVKKSSKAANAPLTVRPRKILQKRGGSLSMWSGYMQHCKYSMGDNMPQAVCRHTADSRQTHSSPQPHGKARLKV